jgi:quinol monooxygenase YgiN
VSIYDPLWGGVIEHAELSILEDPMGAFDAAVAEHMQLVAAAPGCLGMLLLRDDEPDGNYVLLIGWRDLADRLAFRESADYERWRAAVHGYLATPPTARHLTLVCGSPARRDGG